MTWPFENDTSAITKKLAKKSLQSEKRRNLMVVIAVALAAFLICFTGIVSTSLTQMQRNQVVDTYEAVWLGVEENDIETLKGLPEFERVGGYYMLGEELSEQGYHASYVYCDAQMMEIAKAQMELLEGRVPEKANEVVVSEYFLSTYGNNAKIGDTVTLDTESFHGDYVVTVKGGTYVPLLLCHRARSPKGFLEKSPPGRYTFPEKSGILSYKKRNLRMAPGAAPAAGLRP